MYLKVEYWHNVISTSIRTSSTSISLVSSLKSKEIKGRSWICLQYKLDIIDLGQSKNFHLNLHEATLLTFLALNQLWQHRLHLWFGVMTAKWNIRITLILIVILVSPITIPFFTMLPVHIRIVVSTFVHCLEFKFSCLDDWSLARKPVNSLSKCFSS